MYNNPSLIESAYCAGRQCSAAAVCAYLMAASSCRMTTPSCQACQHCCNCALLWCQVALCMPCSSCSSCASAACWCTCTHPCSACGNIAGSYHLILRHHCEGSSMVTLQHLAELLSGDPKRGLLDGRTVGLPANSFVCSREHCLESHRIVVPCCTCLSNHCQ